MKYIKQYNFLISEMENAYHNIAERMGFSDSVMMILYALCSYDGSCLLREIINYTGGSKQTINSALRKLEKDGVVIVLNEDKKRKRVEWTKKGETLAYNTVHKLINIENGIFNEWTADEVDKYFELTKRFITAIKEKTKEI